VASLAASMAGERVHPSRFADWVRRHPLGGFVVLAYALSWTVWIPGLLLGGSALTIVVGGFGPAVAAGLVTHWTGGSVGEWLRLLWRWRLPARFYLYALGLPVFLFGAMNVELALLGEEVDLGRLGDAIPAYLATFVAVALVGGGQEEPGWRGFALDRYQARHSPVVATLLLGLVWGAWHLPLYGLAFLGPMLFVFFYTWLYNRTGSVLLCVLLHGSFTPALDHLILSDDSATVDGVIVLTMVAAAAVLVALTRGRLGLDPRPRTPPLRGGSTGEDRVAVSG
jgi:membrane protease YdiL (CAAX protease family)